MLRHFVIYLQYVDIGYLCFLGNSNTVYGNVNAHTHTHIYIAYNSIINCLKWFIYKSYRNFQLSCVKSVKTC